jgi:hypothetical protein
MIKKGNNKMRNCKDCLHSEVCYFKADFVKVDACAHYKELTDFPCKKRDEVCSKALALLVQAIAQVTVNTYFEQGAAAAHEVFEILKQATEIIDNEERGN